MFALITFLMTFFNFANVVPDLNVLFRVVPEGQGSFSMGVLETFVNFLGMVPAPTFYGVFIDKSCKLWSIDDCTGERGSCLEYDHKLFRFYFFTICLGVKVVSITAYGVALKLYKKSSRKRQTPMTEDESNSNTALV